MRVQRLRPTTCNGERCVLPLAIYIVDANENQLSQISTNEFNRLIDGQINRPQEMVIKQYDARLLPQVFIVIDTGTARVHLERSKLS